MPCKQCTVRCRHCNQHHSKGSVRLQQVASMKPVLLSCWVHVHRRRKQNEICQLGITVVGEQHLYQIRPTPPPPTPKEGTFLQNPHAVGIISFLAQVMPGGNHLGGQAGSQSGLRPLRQLAATHTTTHPQLSFQPHTKQDPLSSKLCKLCKVTVIGKAIKNWLQPTSQHNFSCHRKLMMVMMAFRTRLGHA